MLCFVATLVALMAYTVSVLLGDTPKSFPYLLAYFVLLVVDCVLLFVAVGRVLRHRAQSRDIERRLRDRIGAGRPDIAG